MTIAQWLGLSLLAPNKKIGVLLIGNHSAGRNNLLDGENSNAFLLL